MGLRFESVKVHPWPHGQVVKTAASHAVNIGSNPVRVTTSKQAADHAFPRRRENLFPPLLFLFHLETLTLVSRWIYARDLKKVLTSKTQDNIIKVVFEQCSMT